MSPNCLFAAIIALAISSNIPLHAQDDALQSWTSKDGRTIQAKFVKLDGDTVVVRKDGKDVPLPFAKLNAASVVQAKKLAGNAPKIMADAIVSGVTFDPAKTEPIKPLWMLPASAFEDPAAPGKVNLVGQDSPKSTKSGDLAFAFSSGGTKAAALVNGKTGKLLWRTSFNDKPEGTVEWGRGCKEGPDGHIYQCSVTAHDAGNFKLERALLHLRKLDASSGKILAHLKMAMDDPNLTEEPKGVAWIGGEFDIAVEFTAQQVLVANGRFLAEVDLNLSKVLRSTLLPKKWQDTRYTSIDSKGAYAFWYWDADRRMEKVFARPGEEPREVPPAKAGWKVVNASPIVGKGHIMVECQSPDKQSWAAGAYDPSNDSWAWVKTDTELTKPTPGKSKNLAEISFDGRISETTGEKYEGKWIVDADTGALRYRPPGYDELMYLPDGKIWNIPSEYQVKKGRANEALLFNPADATVVAKLPRAVPFPERREMLKLRDGHILIAAVKEGAVEIEVISAQKKTIYPPRKIALELPSPPKDVELLTYGVDDIPAAVMKVTSADGKDYFCAIPLPSR